MTAHLHYAPNARRGFTLVELMVVLVIISILSALTLAGLAGARQRAKIDKTKSTIRKIHEIVMPQYESYLSRRLPTAIYSSGTNQTIRAQDRLKSTRKLMAAELPDQWADVSPATPLPSWALTAASRRYAARKTALMAGPNWASNGSQYYESAECLFMVLNVGGFAIEAAENFRSDEVGDRDRDGAPEFLDGWGQPIRFVRWPAGFTISASQDSPLQIRISSENPDPFDPLHVSGIVNYPPLTSPPSDYQGDYGLVPLIYSAGPDGATQTDLSASGDAYGIQGSAGALAAGWLSTSGVTLLTTRYSDSGMALAGTVTDWQAAQDNITNHDLMSKR